LRKNSEVSLSIRRNTTGGSNSFFKAGVPKAPLNESIRISAPS